MAKCPDCGAPQGTVVAPRKGFARASAAGFILIVAFALGTFQGLFIVADPELPANQPAIYGAEFPVNGTVRDETGAPAAGINVTFADRNVLTDENGSYLFTAVPSGVVDVVFRGEGRGNLTVRVFLYRATSVDADLRAPGSPDERVNHESSEVMNLAFQICGFVLIGSGLLCLLGGIAAYRRRRWGLALAGAVAALFVSPPVSLAVGGLAIFLVSRAKNEFQRLP